MSHYFIPKVTAPAYKKARGVKGLVRRASDLERLIAVKIRGTEKHVYELQTFRSWCVLLCFPAGDITWVGFKKRCQLLA